MNRKRRNLDSEENEESNRVVKEYSSMGKPNERVIEPIQRSINSRFPVSNQQSNDSNLNNLNSLQNRTKSKIPSKRSNNSKPRFVTCPECDDFFSLEIYETHKQDCGLSKVSKKSKRSVISEIPHLKSPTVSEISSYRKIMVELDNSDSPNVREAQDEESLHQTLHSRIIALEEKLNRESNEEDEPEYSLRPIISITIKQNEELEVEYRLTKIIGNYNYFTVVIVEIYSKTNSFSQFLINPDSECRLVISGQINILNSNYLEEYNSIKIPDEIATLTQLESESFINNHSVNYQLQLENDVQSVSSHSSLNSQVSETSVSNSSESSQSRRAARSEIINHMNFMRDFIFSQISFAGTYFSIDDSSYNMIDRMSISKSNFEKFKFILKDEINTNKSCIFCFEDMIKGNQVMTSPCFHMFHYECAVKWFVTNSNSNCPICQYNLIEFDSTVQHRSDGESP